MNCKIFSLAEAAKVMSDGRTFIFKEIRVGNLEAKKAGRRILITWDAIEKWLSKSPLDELRTQPSNQRPPWRGPRNWPAEFAPRTGQRN